MLKQSTAKASRSGSGDWSLVPPGSDDFDLYGGSDVIRRAREWAFDHQLLLYRGPAEKCVHGLYRMDTCSPIFPCGHEVGMDHTQIWVQHDARGAFILTHPYVKTIPAKLSTYARMHGLQVDSYPWDRWYHPEAMPIRLTIPEDWPLWPIERDAAALLHTQPVKWPAEDRG